MRVTVITYTTSHKRYLRCTKLMTPRLNVMEACVMINKLALTGAIMALHRITRHGIRPLACTVRQVPDQWRWSLTVIEVVRSGGDDVGVEMAAVVVAADKDGLDMVWWKRRLVKDGGNDDGVMWCVAWWRWWSLEHSRNLTCRRWPELGRRLAGKLRGEGG
ncbi:hypothetical protein Tco_0653401 [Tanacetum coccineum]|uniref:Uncharacterized protein n=1 Tax=Tanacetum coccineum TaxID=301880 RepID=A0ABQ4X0F6_9ASTR